MTRFRGEGKFQIVLIWNLFEILDFEFVILNKFVGHCLLRGSWENRCFNEKKTSSFPNFYRLFDSWEPHLFWGEGDPSPPSPPKGAGPDQGQKFKTGRRESEVEGRSKAAPEG